MVSDSWFRNFWKTSRKHEAALEKSSIGVLAFEVASLMSKLVHLWHSLSDKQVAKLREEIMKSVGIKKLVSDDDDYIGKLIYAEIMENMIHVGNPVGRLAKKCNDVRLKSFKQAFSVLIKFGVDPYGWQFTWKKMDKKAKKMERFFAVNANLYQEMDMLADLEQSLKRMKCNNDPDDVNLQEFQRKVTWKQHEVKHLKEVSLWSKTYDYTVLLLARALFTIFAKISHVFGFQQMLDVGETKGSEFVSSDHIHRSHSVSGQVVSSVRPSDNGLPRFALGPLGTEKSALKSKAIKNNSFYSGSFVPSASTTKSGPIAGKNRNANFYSGPLVKLTTKSGLVLGISKATKKLWQTLDHSHGINGKKSQFKPNRSTQVGPFKGWMVLGNGSSTTNSHLSSNGVHSRIINELEDGDTELLNSTDNIIHSNPSMSISKIKLLNPPPDTLGDAALALHYANVIIVIEKLAASPHLIGIDARDDLYNMLPASIRSSLRARLKPYSKSLAMSGYDTNLAKEWSEAMGRILEWSAPLAHNMTRWQSERSYEQQSLVSRTNVLLVQTLYFANQEKTEAIITELLVGLNYIWRLGREELNAKSLVECSSRRIYGEYSDIDG